MKIYVSSTFVDDQAKAVNFYTEKLGFVKKRDIPLGEHRWLTVTSPESENGIELLLEPSEHPAVAPFKQALVNDGIPFTSFQVDDIEAEYNRLKSMDVEFVQEPMVAGDVTMAVLNDTCGNLIQLVQIRPKVA